jgi:ribosome biogenesis protein Tsr3
VGRAGSVRAEPDAGSTEQRDAVEFTIIVSDLVRDDSVKRWRRQDVVRIKRAMVVDLSWDETMKSWIGIRTDRRKVPHLVVGPLRVCRVHIAVKCVT